MNSGCRSANNPINNDMSGRDDAGKNNKNAKRKKSSFFFLLCLIVVWVGIVLVELASIIIGALGAWVNPTQYIRTE